jgi:hypothetical protein
MALSHYLPRRGLLRSQLSPTQAQSLLHAEMTKQQKSLSFRNSSEENPMAN